MIDIGATDCLAPASELKKADITPIGKMVYELADGKKKEYSFGLTVIEFMGEITAGHVIFGPDGVSDKIDIVKSVNYGCFRFDT